MQSASTLILPNTAGFSEIPISSYWTLRENSLENIDSQSYEYKAKSVSY
jgi:hypothetical protein